MKNECISSRCNCGDFSEAEVYGAHKIFFGTLVSESRIKIINLLRKNKMNVSEIAKELGADQTAVSHDLRRLKECGFVTVDVDGKYRYYKINEETISPIMDLIDKHMAGHCVHILEAKKK